jgi:hypothetical protein
MEYADPAACRQQMSHAILLDSAMKRYAGHAGETGIVAYEPEPEAIAVRFKNRYVYVYDYRTTGWAKVERMKQLAAQGRGLSTFISQHVRGAYARKIAPGHARRRAFGERHKRR